MKFLRCLLLVCVTTAFSPLTPNKNVRGRHRCAATPLTRLLAVSSSSSSSRREWCRQAATIATVSSATIITAALSAAPSVCQAADGVVKEAESASRAAVVDTKTFVDPEGYFAITVPKQYFTIRRSAKGDLPNAKTGQGRRGSSIFTAGDMAKAEVVAVERFPTRVLLEEAGIEATGDLSTFRSLGEPTAIAKLINSRREKDKPGNSMSSNTMIVPDSIALSSDGMELSFALKSEIEVQKPELLMEQYGVSQLFRVTCAKASLASRDGNIMAVFASALQQDYDGPDGEALRNAVASFTVTNRQQSPA